MRIKLITKEEHKSLSKIHSDFPALSLQNKGYETIDKSKLSDDDINQIAFIEEILKRSIAGFSSFQNFKINNAGDIQLRIQYDYSYDGSGIYFIGVGYIKLDELLNGFTD